MDGTLKWLVAAFAAAAGLSAAQEQEAGPSLDMKVAVSKELYAPGDTVHVALLVGIPKSYHLYGNPLGPGIGRPLTIGMKGGEGVSWVDIVQMKPKKYVPAVGEWVWAYEKSTVFFLRGVAGAAGEVKGTAVFNGLVCHTSCYLKHYELPFVVRIGQAASPQKRFVREKKLASMLDGKTQIMVFESDSGPQEVSALQAPGADITSIGGASIEAPPGEGAVPAWHYTPVEAQGDLNIWLAIFFGFIAGIILNAMPCVLPVLGVKILSFAEGQRMGRKGAVLRSLVFSAGVISVFLLLAALTAYANYSWGRQFQDPRALVAIVTLIVIFALGMFDVFMIAVPASVSRLEEKSGSGWWRDFFKGIFATVLATPCSGPFLGAVLAWSVTQPAAVIFIVYGSIGAGMSFPYIVLSASRRLACLIPKPGKWMQDFKGFMGFLLIGFAVYLMLGLPSDLVVPAVLFCVTTSLAVVIVGRFAPWGSSWGRKGVSLLLALAVAAGGYFLAFKFVYPSFSAKAAAGAGGKELDVWRPFTAEALIKAHEEGRNAIVDFTANWCMNCQYNTLMVLTKKQVTGLIRQKNVLALTVDMTMPDPVQDSLLHSLGSRSIPFLAIFPGERPFEPVVMRDILTKGRLMRALERLKPAP